MYYRVISILIIICVILFIVLMVLLSFDNSNNNNDPSPNPNNQEIILPIKPVYDPNYTRNLIGIRNNKSDKSDPRKRKIKKKFKMSKLHNYFAKLKF